MTLVLLLWALNVQVAWQSSRVWITLAPDGYCSSNGGKYQYWGTDIASVPLDACKSFCESYSAKCIGITYGGALCRMHVSGTDDKLPQNGASGVQLESCGDAQPHPFADACTDPPWTWFPRSGGGGDIKDVYVDVTRRRRTGLSWVRCYKLLWSLQTSTWEQMYSNVDFMGGVRLIEGERNHAATLEECKTLCDAEPTCTNSHWCTQFSQVSRRGECWGSTEVSAIPVPANCTDVVNYKKVTRHCSHNYIGCYQDNLITEFNYGTKGLGYTPDSCAIVCADNQHFVLRASGYCSCDYSYSSPSTVHKVNDNICGSSIPRLGGAWSNAVYSNTCETSTPVTYRVTSSIFATTTTTSIFATTTTASILATTTIASAVQGIVLFGQLILEIPNSQEFLAEPSLNDILLGIISLVMGIPRDWVHDVHVFLNPQDMLPVGNRRLNLRSFWQDRVQQHSLTSRLRMLAEGAPLRTFRILFEIEGTDNVGISWRVQIPDDNPGNVTATLLLSKFNSESVAQITKQINEIIAESIGNKYNVSIVWKYLKVEDPSTETQATDGGAAIVLIIVLLIAILFFSILCPFVAYRIHMFRQATKLPMVSLMSRRSSQSPQEYILKAGGPYGKLNHMDLLKPPKTITEVMRTNLKHLARSMVDYRNITAPVFLTYALGHRSSDADFAGPGMFHAIAISKLLYEHGIQCFSDLAFPDDVPRALVSIEIGSRFSTCRVLLVLQTHAMYKCEHCMKEIFTAQTMNIEIIPIRIEEDLPSLDDQWPYVAQDDIDSVLMLAAVQEKFGKCNSMPAPPFTVPDQPSVLDDLLIDLLLKLGQGTLQQKPTIVGSMDASLMPAPDSFLSDDRFSGSSRNSSQDGLDEGQGLSSQSSQDHRPSPHELDGTGMAETLSFSRSRVDGNEPSSPKTLALKIDTRAHTLQNLASCDSRKACERSPARLQNFASCDSRKSGERSPVRSKRRTTETGAKGVQETTFSVAASMNSTASNTSLIKSKKNKRRLKPQSSGKHLRVPGSRLSREGTCAF